MKNRIVALSNGWTAEFTNLGEFKMSCEGWDMLLVGPDGQSIRYFQKRVVLVNDDDGKQAQSCIQLSDDGKHGYLTDGLDGAWVLDFERRMVAPHRLYIHHHQGDKYVSAFEQPTFRCAREYVTISGKLIYITFPFCAGTDLPAILGDYIVLRKRQLDELYFSTS